MKAWAGRVKSDRGNVLLILAFVLPMLIGLTALAVDVGFMFEYRQRMQAAADGAAVSGAFEVAAGNGANVTAWARNDTVRNGFTDGANGVTVTVNSPPTSGAYSGTAGYVEVIISRVVPTYFMRMFGRNSTTVKGRAVAGPGSAGGCIYALNQDTKYAPEFDDGSGGGSPTINVPNCGVVSNGNLTVGKSAKLTATSIAVTGTYSNLGSGNVTGRVATGVAASTDPLASLNETSLFGTSWTCDYGLNSTYNKGKAFQWDKGTVPTVRVGTNVYCGKSGTPAIKIGGSTSEAVTFPAGVYIINGGGLDWKHTLINGTGVTFYFTGDVDNTFTACGQKMFDTDAPDIFNFSAPTSGSYAGLLFIQDRTKGTGCLPATPVIANILPSDMVIDGAMYFPGLHVAYGATTSSSSNYTVLVGSSLTFSGVSVLKSNFKGGGIAGNPLTTSRIGE